MKTTTDSFREDTGCTLCGKELKDILVLTRVVMDIHSRYHREDDTFENMNGLRKQTEEYFCEECFQLFVNKVFSVVSERQPTSPA